MEIGFPDSLKEWIRLKNMTRLTSYCLATTHFCFILVSDGFISLNCESCTMKDEFGCSYQGIKEQTKKEVSLESAIIFKAQYANFCIWN